MIEAWRNGFDNPNLASGIIAQETDQEPLTPDNFLSGITDNGCLIRKAHYNTFAAIRKAGDKNVGFAGSGAPLLRPQWRSPPAELPSKTMKLPLRSKALL